MKSRIGIAATIFAVLITVSAVGCGPARWCEEDATDTRVPDSYCDAETPGYEWEPDHKKRKPASKAKPTPKPTTRR